MKPSTSLSLPGYLAIAPSTSLNGLQSKTLL
jgi:hypothetical protein